VSSSDDSGFWVLVGYVAGSLIQIIGSWVRSKYPPARLLPLLLLPLLACGVPSGDVPELDAPDAAPLADGACVRTSGRYASGHITAGHITAGHLAGCPGDTRRLYVYGDSILAGGHATSPELEAIALLAPRYPGTIVNNSVSGRALYVVADTAPKRAVITAAIVASGATEVWLELELNDFVLAGAVPPRTDLTEFTTLYPLLLDAIHAAAPNVHVYAQSAIAYGHSHTNSVGETLESYSAAVAAAVVGREAWATYVDGAPIVTYPADLVADKTHLNNSGCAKMAPAMALELGL
jgi:hypothetical protein